jgi:hypothetical protein
MTASEFLREAEKLRLDAATFKSFSLKRVAARNDKGDFADGPPCLQNLAKIGFPEGGRNNALFHMAVYYQMTDDVRWKEMLVDANARLMKPALGNDEVQGVIKSLEKKDYRYKCNDEPMCSHCDSLLCRTRKYGVGDGGAAPITNLTRIASTPAIWFVEVNGTIKLEISSEQLANPRLFKLACMEQGHFFPLLKQVEWDAHIKDAVANHDTINPGEGVRVEGQFLEMLEDFLTNRFRSDSREDLLLGRPWQDEEAGKYYFRLRDLMRFLNREDFRDNGQRVKRARIANWIRDLGGGGGERDKDRFEVKGCTVRYYWVPNNAVQKQPNNLDLPPIAESPIL